MWGTRGSICLALLIAMQILSLLGRSPAWLEFIRIVLLWVIAAVLLAQLRPAQLLGKKKVHDALLVIAFLMLSFLAVSQTLEQQRNRLLDDPFTTVTFVATNAAELSIPVAENFSGGALPQAEGFARAFGSQDTLWSTPTNFVITSPSSTSYYALTPYGLRGILLQLYNSLISTALVIVLLGVLALGVIAVVGNNAKSFKASSISFVILVVSYGLFFDYFLAWYSTVLLAPTVILAFLGLLFMLTFPFAKRIRNILESFIEQFKELFQSVRTAPIGISGLLVLRVLLDGFGLSYDVLASLAVCILLFIIVYMWHKTLLIHTQKDHPHAPHLPIWLAALSCGLIPFLFISDIITSAVTALIIAIVGYAISRSETGHRIVLGFLFVCGALYLGWYSFDLFMTSTGTFLSSARDMLGLGGFSIAFAIWTMILLLVNAIFIVLAYISFVYELARD